MLNLPAMSEGTVHVCYNTHIHVWHQAYGCCVYPPALRVAKQFGPTHDNAACETCSKRARHRLSMQTKQGDSSRAPSFPTACEKHQTHMTAPLVQFPCILDFHPTSNSTSKSRVISCCDRVLVSVHTDFVNGNSMPRLF
jgi:hypothetical protein